MTFSSSLHQYLTSKLWLRFVAPKQNPHCCRIGHSTGNPILLRKHFMLFATFLFVSVQATGSSADTLRCGTKLVREDELAIQVREKCGDPVSEELIGYRLGPAPFGLRGERELKIEQWVYGPEQGYYHVLIFEGGRLRNIDNVRQ